MRLLVLLFALISLPAFAADYSVWADQQSCATDGGLLAQAPPPYQDPSKPRPATRHPGEFCCRHCNRNEIACGSTCMPALTNGKKSLCKSPPGCACGPS